VQVVGHRGAPYYVPEHTLASYEIAMRQGVDWIEPDLCITNDSKLVIIHDLELGLSHCLLFLYPLVPMV